MSSIKDNNKRVIYRLHNAFKVRHSNKACTQGIIDITLYIWCKYVIYSTKMSKGDHHNCNIEKTKPGYCLTETRIQTLKFCN